MEPGPQQPPNQALIVVVQACGEVARQRPQFYALMARATLTLASSTSLVVGSGPSPQTSLAHALKKALAGKGTAPLPFLSPPPVRPYVTNRSPASSGS